MLGSEDPEQWQGNICDDPIDAQRCPYFTPAKDAKTIVAEFMELVKEPSWVETNMPVVSALLWVAGPLAPIKDPSGVEGPETSEVEGPEFLQTTVESDDVRIENRLVKVEVVPADSGEAVRVEERAMNVTVLHYKPKESFWKRFLDWLGSSK
jgi:hypothetical protein